MKGKSAMRKLMEERAVMLHVFGALMVHVHPHGPDGSCEMCGGDGAHRQDCPYSMAWALLESLEGETTERSVAEIMREMGVPDLWEAGDGQG